MNNWPSKFKDPRWRKRQKKHIGGSAADKLLKLASQEKAENVDLIKTLLDELWRQSMNGGMLNDKVIKTAQKFIRDVESLNQKRQK